MTSYERLIRYRLIKEPFSTPQIGNIPKKNERTKETI